jgi:hypothetical protein
MVVMDCYLRSKQHAESVSFAAALCASANGDGTRTAIVVRGAEDQFYGGNDARHQPHKRFGQPQPPKNRADFGS